MIMTRLGAIALSLAFAILATLPASAAETSISNHPGEGLAWQTSAEGVAFAALVGDRFAEPYMAMVRLPAGLVSPAHRKTANMFGVIISGAMVHSVSGADPASEIVLQQGSFYRIPKNLPHVSKCVSKVDCVTFLYQDGKFDFLPEVQ